MKSLINMIYDFERRPYDVDWWGTLSGVPQRVGSNLEVGGSSTVMSAEFMKGNLEMEITMSANPIAGETKQFGWFAPGQGAYAYFEVSGTTFQAAAGDGEGHTQTSAITWNTAWLDTATLFKIVWDSSGFTFFIDGVRKAKISEEFKMPRVPMSPYFRCSGGGDKLVIPYVSVLGAQTMFHIESVNSDYVLVDIGHTPSVSDSITIADVVTIIPSLGINQSDSEAIAEAVTMFTNINYQSLSDSESISEDIAIAVV